MSARIPVRAALSPVRENFSTAKNGSRLSPQNLLRLGGKRIGYPISTSFNTKSSPLSIGTYDTLDVLTRLDGNSCTGSCYRGVLDKSFARGRYVSALSHAPINCSSFRLRRNK